MSLNNVDKIHKLNVRMGYQFYVYLMPNIIKSKGCNFCFMIICYMFS